jgi:hypothetical protein
MAGPSPAMTIKSQALPLNTSLPGLTRQSMMNRNSENQYCSRAWRLIMDARVKPGHDAYLFVQARP